MNKDEMKNRISIALKDPILQQGFEIICKENAELKSIAEFQQSSNMDTHLENKKLKEGLLVGSTFNKALNSRNKFLEEENDKYRNMVFDKKEQLTRAIEHLKDVYKIARGDWNDPKWHDQVLRKAEQFLKESE